MLDVKVRKHSKKTQGPSMSVEIANKYFCLKYKGEKRGGETEKGKPLLT